LRWLGGNGRLESGEGSIPSSLQNTSDPLPTVHLTQHFSSLPDLITKIITYKYLKQSRTSLLYQVFLSEMLEYAWLLKAMTGYIAEIHSTYWSRARIMNFGAENTSGSLHDLIGNIKEGMMIEEIDFSGACESQLL